MGVWGVDMRVCEYKCMGVWLCGVRVSKCVGAGVWAGVWVCGLCRCKVDRCVGTWVHGCRGCFWGMGVRVCGYVFMGVWGCFVCMDLWVWV